MGVMKVFISYSSKELNKALELKTILEGNGFICWMAPYSIPAGSDYGTEIPTAINACDVFVLILSYASQNSLWVPKEVDFALTNHKLIIPFHIDGSEMGEAFNFRLSNIQRIEAYKRASEAYRTLVDRINAISGIEKSQKSDSVQPSAFFSSMTKKSNVCPISFNAIPGNSYIAAKETKPDLPYRKGPIIINHEESFWILTRVQNTCPREDAVANNVRLSMRIIQTSKYMTRVESVIICPNATPQKKEQSISFNCDEPFELKYVSGSAYLYSEFYGLVGSRGLLLCDDIIKEKGALLGFWEIDGRIPGGINNVVTVSIKVNVIKKR